MEEMEIVVTVEVVEETDSGASCGRGRGGRCRGRVSKRRIKTCSVTKALGGWRLRGRALER